MILLTGKWKIDNISSGSYCKFVIKKKYDDIMTILQAM